MRQALCLCFVLLLGIGLGEWLTTQFWFRQWVAHVVRGDKLKTLVGRRGTYDSDVERAWLGELFADGSSPDEIAPSLAAEAKRGALARLAAREKLHLAASREPVDSAAVAFELNLLRWQFPDEKSWEDALRRAATSTWQLRREVQTNLRDRNWLEKQIEPLIQPNDSEERRYFESHPEEFQEPPRLRASHLFLAAPIGYPKDVIETKRALINQLSQRLAKGESFDALVPEFSEDEATRAHGGDLNWFAAARMLPEVFATAEKLQPGQISGPVRSRLGFHIIRLSAVRPARQLRFEEACPEIAAILKNEARQRSVTAILP
jgi:hypothetical protein